MVDRTTNSMDGGYKMGMGIINKVNGAITSFKNSLDMGQTTDSVSKNIRDQIANAQNQLQEISSNKEMSVEQKMKRRQEIQQQISDLNNQLRQHQIEQRKQQQEKKMSKDGGMNRENQEGLASKENLPKTGLTQDRMKAMISADSSVKQAKIQGNTADSFEHRADIVKVEIELDIARASNVVGRTANVSGKYAELAKVEQKAEDAMNSQAKTLGEVNTEIKETQEKEQRPENKEHINENAIDAQEKNHIEEQGIPNKTKQDESEISIKSEEADGQKDIVYKKIDVYV